jgi:hypothetical protein
MLKKMIKVLALVFVAALLLGAFDAAVAEPKTGSAHSVGFPSSLGIVQSVSAGGLCADGKPGC